LSGVRRTTILHRKGTFDAALLEALLAIGVPAERARAVIDLLDRRIDERYSLHAQVLATKRDVAELNARVAEVNAGLSARITEVDAHLSARIAALDATTTARVAHAKSDVIRWVLTALTAQTALLLGAMKRL
jgi:hypothetical protein